MNTLVLSVPAGDMLGQGQNAKQQLLQSGGVSDYKFSTATSNGGLQGVYGQAPPASCQLAVCAHFADQVLCYPFSVMSV